MFDQFLSKAGELLASGQPFAIAEVVHYLKPVSGKPGDKAIISADGTIWGWIGGGCAQPAVVSEALKALKDGRPRLVRIGVSAASEEGVVAYNMSCHSGGTLEVYIEPVLPKPHVLILGGSPVGRVLSKLAKAINYTVTVAAHGADRECYPDADQICADLTLSGLKFSPQAFMVVSTQGEHDEEALEMALQTGATYVAFVASKAKATRVIQSLRERGIEKTQLERVHAPAGLNIQARSQGEIAVSILAEIVELSRTQPLATKETAISAAPAKEATDPVCGMTVQIAGAKHTSEFNRRSFYFCCGGCKSAFDREPEKYSVANLPV